MDHGRRRGSRVEAGTGSYAGLGGPHAGRQVRHVRAWGGTGPRPREVNLRTRTRPRHVGRRSGRPGAGPGLTGAGLAGAGFGVYFFSPHKRTPLRQRKRTKQAAALRSTFSHSCCFSFFRPEGAGHDTGWRVRVRKARLLAAGHSTGQKSFRLAASSIPCRIRKN